MSALLVMALLLAGWLVYLVLEAMGLERHRRAVPLRIAVTGTRGKTTVCRRLAAVLREDGRRVLTKTTGSEAAYLFPDGSVQEIHRVGVPSIIEQKRLLRRGAALKADVLLAEVMSVHPENHRVEVHQILRPHMVLVTNFRVDHMEAQGASRRDVASVLALDVAPGSRVLVPEEELEEAFLTAAVATGGRVEVVPRGSGRGDPDPSSRSAHLPPDEFGPNVDLVWAAARTLGVPDDRIREGLHKAQADVGALRRWRYLDSEGGDPWILVSAFAANDPESTIRVYDRVLGEENVGWDRCVGLLSLRPDRGDRTLQWVTALEEGAIQRFRTLFVYGLHAHALAHRLGRHPLGGRVRVLKPAPPHEIMEEVLGGEAGGGLLFGFGNIGGLGRTMVRHWRKVGEAHGF